DAELEDALASLAKMAGASPDVWLRLGRVRMRVGASSREVREALTRAVAWDDDPDPEARFAARSARLALADVELAEGSAARAEGWLAPIEDGHLDVVRRRLASAVARRSLPDVKRLLPTFSPEVSDAAGQRLLGEAESMAGNPASAARSLARAAILGDDAAIDSLRDAIARAPGLDAATMRAVETVATSFKLEEKPLWRAALASARGDAKKAAAALRDALDSGVRLEGPSDRAAGRGLAVAARDETLLARCAESESATGGTVEIDRALATASTATRSDDAITIAAGLEALLRPTTGYDDPARAAWAGDLRKALVDRLFPRDSPASWDVVTNRLAAHARALGDLDALRRLEHLAAERARPLRIAIVGEFNAGKSTFVNALLGMDVAPTGILPTTAVAHVLRYGPDPIARARLRKGGARTVPPDRLKSLLAELDPTTVSEVEVEMPFPYLQRVELVDTPGFNAPDPTHAKTAMATLIEGAGVDVAIWLFDVGQALKTSERRVLEAIVGRGIPLQALLNKSDRFGAADLDKVMTVFTEDARSIGLVSFRPALAFSARRAVEARLAGDDAKLAESGFLPVRALLEDEMPSHGAALKERALRRRAHDVALALEDVADRAREA
ncbi:MAG: dynamin family protein, partial [Polyangiales bacterium]